MTKVKVLVDAVGEWNAGDIVEDAPAGLIAIAERGTVNAATGQLLAEILDEVKEDDGSELIIIELQSKNSELMEQIKQSEEREKALQEQLNESSEMLAKEIKAIAKEAKISGYTKMELEELKTAIITAAGGGQVGE